MGGPSGPGRGRDVGRSDTGYVPVAADPMVYASRSRTVVTPGYRGVRSVAVFEPTWVGDSSESSSPGRVVDPGGHVGHFVGDGGVLQRPPDVEVLEQLMPPVLPPVEPPVAPIRRKVVGSRLALDVGRTRSTSSVSPRDKKAAVDPEPKKALRDPDALRCKERPTDNRPKGGGGSKRGFIPWCR